MQQKSTACGHLFCNSCWAGYIGTAINDGPGCLILRCPDASCSAAVCQDMINKAVSKEDKDKYDRHFLRSYIEYNKKAKWCPAPGCDYAVTFVGDCENYDIIRCRGVLKWTHLYGYYLPVNEHVKEQFFEYLQGEAEACLEQLQHCAEELQDYLNSESLPREFHEVRTNLADLTRGTRTYFDNLVQALEDALLDVDLHGAIHRLFDLKSPRDRLNIYYSGDWSCQQCTFVNCRYTTVCHIRHHRR